MSNNPRTANNDRSEDATIEWEVPRLDVVLGHVRYERASQDRKWGEQNHHDFDPILMSRVGGCSEQRMANHYEIPTADRARFACDQAHRIGHGSWADILIEEVAEVVGSCNASPEVLRAELVQVAAVAVAWVECIDRRIAACTERPAEPEDNGSSTGVDQ